MCILYANILNMNTTYYSKMPLIIKIYSYVSLAIEQNLVWLLTVLFDTTMLHLGEKRTFGILQIKVTACLIARIFYEKFHNI